MAVMWPGCFCLSLSKFGDHYPGSEAHHMGSSVFSLIVLSLEQRWSESVQRYFCGNSCNNRDLDEERGESLFFHISGCHTILNLQRLELESAGADGSSSEEKTDIELTTIADVNITTWDAPWDARTFRIIEDETI
ncbi:hypothetical protein BDP27DRAFT_1364166 [Rhodocollybia butyracea]|uniref:Uncharacterized protein n=1 Tax=Rhodocollybia butyracea TaxID=206335 RepID=A0A9P5PUX7_9AGAR|nr:hypothetical protein BDP27DRAFT_1364166 [Rhodocollybia butyracea]